jgi:hypothetical protein
VAGLLASSAGRAAALLNSKGLDSSSSSFLLRTFSTRASSSGRSWKNLQARRKRRYIRKVLAASWLMV